MLGVIGFLCLAAIAAGFAYSSAAYYKNVPAVQKTLLTGGYSILAVTSLVWLATFFVPTEAVVPLVVMSDILLVAASICVLGVVINIAKPSTLATLSLIGAGLITLRVYVIPSQAYVADGLLHFNLSQVESLVIGLLFLAAWLPATVKVLNSAFSIPKLAPYRTLVIYLFIAAILMTGFFLAARQPLVFIIAFISMLLFFLILTIINLTLVRKAVSPAQPARKESHGQSK